MLLWEVTGDPDAERLTALVSFLAGRARDTGAKQQIGKDAFMSMAQQLGINITDANLFSMIEREPLSNLLDTPEPGSNVITFKSGESDQVDMPVDKAQDIVAKAAKSALQKRT